MSNPTFGEPCGVVRIDALLGLPDIGLYSIGFHVEQRRWGQLGRRRVNIIDCNMLKEVTTCPHCGGPSLVRKTRFREFCHEPMGLRPVVLRVRIRKRSCPQCARVWSADCSLIAGRNGGGKLTKKAVAYALSAVVLDSMSIRSVARNLGCSWGTVNTAVLSTGYEYLINDPERLNGVTQIGVDEHKWKHTGWVSKQFVTVIVDLSPHQTRNGGVARLLDIVPGRSKDVFKAWLTKQTNEFKSKVKRVAMDGFWGYKGAVREALPHAHTILDPFHVIKLAGDKVTKCRQRLQRETTGRRGHKEDLLYKARLTLLTRPRLLGEKSGTRLDTIIKNTKYHQLTRIWMIYQRMIQAYEHASRTKAKNIMRDLIDALEPEITSKHPELRALAKTLRKRKTDILAYFDHPGTGAAPPKPSMDASNTCAA